MASTRRAKNTKTGELWHRRSCQGRLRQSFGKLAIGPFIGASTLGLTSIASFTAVVCNEDGECWHSGDPAGAGVVIHENNWTPGERFRFREHEGRGYWRGGNWVEW
jgi:hypothetical protein